MRRFHLHAFLPVCLAFLLGACSTPAEGIEFRIPGRPSISISYPGNPILGLRTDRFVLAQEVSLSEGQKLELDLLLSEDQLVLADPMLEIHLYSSKIGSGEIELAPLASLKAAYPSLSSGDKRPVRIVFDPAMAISGIPTGGVPLRSIELVSSGLQVLGFGMVEGPGQIPGLRLGSGLIEVDAGLEFRERIGLGAGSQVSLQQDLSWEQAWKGMSLSLHYEFAPGRDRMAFLPEQDLAAPSIQLSLSSADSLTSIQVNAGLKVGQGRIDIPAAMMPFPVQNLRIHSLEAGFRTQLLEVHAGPAKAEEAIYADLESILLYPRSAWRNSDFELFRWSVHPEVFVIDFADREVQSRFFKRLAFFVEKRGFRGRLLGNAELSGRHGWNAHNYRGAGLADFFNQARSQDFPLNPEEEFLLELVLDLGLIQMDTSGVYLEGPGGIISITRDSRESSASRRLLLNHEALHGVYYMNPDLVRQSRAEWANLSEDAGTYIRRYFAYLQYDTSDTYLMENEFQSYMLQQGLQELRWVFGNQYRDRLAAAYPQDAAYFRRIAASVTEEFYNASFRLQSILFRDYGFRGGDLRSLSFH